MNKKCKGCGLLLQDKDKNKKGYVNNLKMDLCRACFRLTHYGENKETNINNDKLINNINKLDKFNLFFVNYLNLNEEILDIYNKLSKPKLLVFTKMDLYPNNLTYKIDENFKDDFIFLSSFSNTSIKNLINLLKVNNINEVVISGLTNSGKSTFINKMTNKKLTVSNKKNVTKDFIKIKHNNIMFYDSPGFDLNLKNHESKVRTYTYQMKQGETLKINNYYINFEKEDNITIYSMFKLNIKKYFKDVKFTNDLTVNNNDLFLEDIGFIYLKNKNNIKINNNKYYKTESIFKE